MVRDEEETDADDAMRDANMLQNKQIMLNTVISKRKDQLRRWASSEMNGEAAVRHNPPRVQFQDIDIFLSACMSGDEVEVKELLEKGADINICTIDGLTALHQAVIDSKPDTVRFLCEHGADVNAQDNEGWTPLHAAACCGNVSIVQYLCQHGADLAIINVDKELALDLADDEACREYLEMDHKRKDVDPERCRDQETELMMRDVQNWLKSGKYNDEPHPRNGAGLLHVAAAKGYTQILELAIKAGGNINAKDKDGFTPLHAAAHWGERDSCKILLEHGADISELNYAGQNVLSVADKDIVEYLEDLVRVMPKRVSPAQPATILGEKNQRVSHEEHIMSTEHKRDLQHRDQSRFSENEILHAPKMPRLSEKSPSVESQSSQSSEESVRSSVEERMPSVDRKNDFNPEEGRSSEERSRSVSMADRSNRSTVSEEKASGKSGSVSSSVGSGLSSQRSSATPSSMTSTTSSRLTKSSSVTTAGSGSIPQSQSSLQSGEQHVSYTMPTPRAVQQPANSWINRGVQLITRSASTSGSTRSDLDSQCSSSSTTTSAGASSTTTSSTSTPSTISVSDQNSNNSNLTSHLVLAKPKMCSSPVQRSTSIPANLPWISLCRSTGAQQAGSSPAFSHNRVSAFRAPQKTLHVQHTELPRSLHPQALNPIKMRPWQSNTVNESEAERRNNSRMQRQHRRSTQGVTKEQLEEASRVATEETARRRQASSTNHSATQLRPASGVVRLASEDSMSISGSERESAEKSSSHTIESRPSTYSGRIENRDVSMSSDRSNSTSVSGTGSTSGTGSSTDASAASVSATATLSLPGGAGLSPSATPSAAHLRRKTQGMSSLVRSNRRGTGPVAAEDVAAASQLSSTRPEVSSRTAFLSRPTSQPTTQRFSSSSDRSDKSLPQQTSSQSTVSGLRSVAVPPTSTLSSAALSKTPRIPVQPVSANSHTSNYTVRPTETNLNYKALYEKERHESERLRREMDDMRRTQSHESASSRLGSAGSRMLRNGSPCHSVQRSSSGASMDDVERKAADRRIQDLEHQLKGMQQLRLENQRLKEENGALVRVISKMTT